MCVVLFCLNRPDTPEMKMLNNEFQMGLQRDTKLNQLAAISMLTLATVTADWKDRKPENSVTPVLNELAALVGQQSRPTNRMTLDGHAKEFETLYRQASTHQVNPTDVVQNHGWNYDGPISIPMYELQLSCFLQK